MNGMILPSAQLRTGIGNLLQGRTDTGGIGQPVCGRVDLSHRTGEQFNAKPFFEFADLLSDRTGRDIKFIRSQ